MPIIAFFFALKSIFEVRKKDLEKNISIREKSIDSNRIDIFHHLFNSILLNIFWLFMQ
jgi:hypothetical protein